MKMFRLALLIAAIVSINAACGSTNPNLTPSSTTTTLMAGWEQHFAIEWAAAEQGPNTRRVSGYVYNQYGQYGATATQMRILAQALDPNGAVIGQRITYVPGGVGGFGRAYFDVPNLPATPAYRVSVWDYTWFQGPGRRFP
jgi:ABC-type glycerol-3-phosphate transport system substrate-binding protein